MVMIPREMQMYAQDKHDGHGLFCTRTHGAADAGTARAHSGTPGSYNAGRAAHMPLAPRCLI
jgi:hypothetical protein